MKLIHEILSEYENVLKDAYTPYLNHCERVFRIAQIMDTEKTIDQKKLGIACAFHDIGIWTGGTWNYLQPSEELCKNYLKKSGREEWTQEILLMIRQHHKLLPYKGQCEQSVELFRKADLVDFSVGTITFSVPRKFYRELIREFPLHGFHGDLAKSFWQHFKTKPWSPFPMVRF